MPAEFDRDRLHFPQSPKLRQKVRAPIGSIFSEGKNFRPQQILRALPVCGLRRIR
jgi:hypothetical protein